MTPENLRFHAAGHLAAAALLVQRGDVAGAGIIMHAIEAFIHHPTVQCPPRIKEMVSDAIENTAAAQQEIETLEAWFVDPFNSTIEVSQNG